MTGVRGDAVGNISRELAENAEWRTELLDESRKPVFRIRLVAETLDWIPFRFNQNQNLLFCFDAHSSREPGPLRWKTL